MAKATESPAASSVRAALEVFTVERLKQLLNLLPGVSKATRKADLITVIEGQLLGEGLQQLWEQLDDTQRLAVAEALYSQDGSFNADRFQAKYGVLPTFGIRDESYRWTLREMPTRLRLFLYQGGRYDSYEGVPVVPADLRVRLKRFVPRPEPLLLQTVGEVPAAYSRIDKEYRWQEGDEGITLVSPGGVYRMPREQPDIIETTHHIAILQRETERDALAEVTTALRLVELGKLTVSDKTQLPGVASLRELGAVLGHGEFYPPDSHPPQSSDDIGPIRAYAWPLLLQAAKLAEPQGKKLVLTKAGYDSLNQPAADILRRIWQSWLKTKQFDEFNRIDTIKGQQGKGQRLLTAPDARRAVIVGALRQCPVGGWIEFERFSRYMQAAGLEFSVTRDPWSLYIDSPEHGSLGYEGFHDWHILQKRYLVVVLFEYAATLGLVDVAYIEPWQVTPDYRTLWGTDDLDYLSRYDGLLYFRINPLGAYALGLADDYRSRLPESRVRLEVLPSLQIKVVAGVLSSAETLFLETWAEPLTDKLWRLDSDRIIDAVERGRTCTELCEFLEARDPQGVPETVAGYLNLTARHARALTNTGRVLLIECADAALADLVAGHDSTRGLCVRVGPQSLAVKIDAVERFREAVHGLGYGLPRV